MRKLERVLKLRFVTLIQLNPRGDIVVVASVPSDSRRIFGPDPYFPHSPDLEQSGEPLQTNSRSTCLAHVWHILRANDDTRVSRHSVTICPSVTGHNGDVCSHAYIS